MKEMALEENGNSYILQLRTKLIAPQDPAQVPCGDA